jgi:hypothetical protein
MINKFLESKALVFFKAINYFLDMKSDIRELRKEVYNLRKQLEVLNQRSENFDGFLKTFNSFENEIIEDSIVGDHTNYQNKKGLN